MSMVGELSCFLGLQIKQRKEGIFIAQEKYAKNIVKKFGLDKSQQQRTPAATYVKITKDSDGESINHKHYRSMIGNSLYLTTSRSDIAYVMGICARFQSEPHVSHLAAIGLDTQMIEKALQKDVSFLETIVSPGSVKNRIVFL
ncbi:putative mitochondrial protein [Cucumis melo var. makuwa]|uniref:Mitochondrial protein n=1 Tax=Cucumis melo var. makuwa TaxID=1194695 RepID=A0A5A7UCD4_CUCMM|nr:putative mitochondrial protein [Cucumis melo var. makuwa]